METTGALVPWRQSLVQAGAKPDVLTGAPGGHVLQGLSAFLPFKEMGVTEDFFSKVLSFFSST